MKIIVSHITPDFDALASMALAQLLHPDAIMVRLGSLSPQVEAVVKLYADIVWLYSVQEINLSDVSELIVVDTSEKSRIAPFDSLIGKVPITLYDHHQQSQDAIPSLYGIHQEIGSTASILTLLLAQKGIQISETLASLALLGIYDDTGSLSFNSTTAQDCEAAAILLRAGASLHLIRDYIHINYSEEHRKFFASMLQNAKQIDIAQRPFVIAELNSQIYIEDLAPLCNSLLEFYNAEAAIIIADMEDDRFIIARASSAFNMADFLRTHFGGGGHPSAASARSNLSSKQVIDLIETKLADFSQVIVMAKDIMSSPVNSISGDNTIAEAQQMILRYGHNGLPVTDAEGNLAGFISRRIIDKAVRHKLAHVAVKEYMTKGAVTALETATLDQLEQLIQSHDIGRIPIIEENNNDRQNNDRQNNKGRMIGIVSRSDVMKARYDLNRKIDTNLSVDTSDVVKKLEHLPQIVKDFLNTSLKVLPEKANLYLVGGSARDLLANLPMRDLDLMVEGILATDFAEQISQITELKIDRKDDFATCTINMSNGLIVDIATTRQEFYDSPGTLPEVAPTTLINDLQRRDYSINAMAIRLNEPVKLFDPYDGLSALEDKTLRLLHPLSLIDDPTRVFRGARLAGRLGLHFPNDTQKLIAEMLKNDVSETISAMRLRSELELILNEDRVLPALKVLEENNVLQTFFQMTVDEQLIENLDKLRQQETVSSESYLLSLFLSTSEDSFEQMLVRYGWKQEFRKSLKQLRKVISTSDISLKDFQYFSAAEKTLLKAYSSELAATLYGFENENNRPLLNGSDVIALGIEQGPAVGKVLEVLARAKLKGQVQSYEDEVALVKSLRIKS